MKTLCVLISLFLFLGCGSITRIINPPSKTDELAKQTLKMHQAIISMQQTSSPETKGSFRLTWKSDPTYGVDGYNIYRSAGLDSQFVFLSSTSATDSQYRDTTALEGIRYRYAVTTFRDTLESNYSNILSGAWVSVGSPTTNREKTCFRDTLWTTDDLLIVLHPAYHPCTIDWIRDAGEESVRWIGLFDVDHNRVVDISDLVYYGANYNKVAWDSLRIKR